MVINWTLVGLICVFIILLFLYLNLRKVKEKSRLHKHFEKFIILFLLPPASLSLQILFSNTSIPPIYFDYVTYIFTIFAPVELLVIALLYNNKDCNLRYIKYLYIISVINIILLWTNDFHHLFYEVYSVDFSKSVVGIGYYTTAIYGYGLIFIDMIIMVLASIRKSGFLSKPTILLLIGVLVPLIGNLLAVAHVITTNIYLTPFLFSVLAICFWLAIFKYKALNIIPIAFRTVMDTMSDAYIVISDDGTIADMNKTFENNFSNVLNLYKESNFFSAIDESKEMNLDEIKKLIYETRKSGKVITSEYKLEISNDKVMYYDVDIHPISAKRKKNEYVGTLLLFKNITQHKLDMQKLEEKQEIIVKQGQLVSIGELAGGVAHDINTPISAIKTGILMLNTMENKRTEQEQEILQRMDNCATKIINIVNSMRNQIRNLGGNVNVKFKLSDVINDIKVITYHEVAKNKSKVEVNIKDDLYVMGDPTKLGQVFTNLIVNAAQAYDENGGVIQVNVKKARENAVIEIKDNAGGLDESIEPFIFKNILTTKGTSGTGLGLYLSYSVIKGEFNGDLTYKTKKGVGTTFYIKIPIEKNN